jgi:hypothetical protein
VLESETTPPRPGFRYHLDKITDEEIAGWIAWPSDPLRRCVVMLKEAEDVLTRVVAS